MGFPVEKGGDKEPENALRVPPLKIMVVDDDPFVRDVVVTALGAVPGVLVTACAGGAEALSVLDSAAPDMLLLDLAMPGMDGRALWSLVQARGHAPRLFFLTGRDDPATRAEVMSLGAQGLIAKPFDPRTFAAAVLAGSEKAKTRDAKLEMLARDFAAHLPAAGAAVTRAWRGTATAWNASAAEDLLTEVHRIAGVAPMFGFAAVGQAADRVEAILRPLVKNGGWRSDAERAVAEDAVKALTAAAEKGR